MTLDGMYQGDSRIFTITVKDQDGELFPLTDCLIVATLKPWMPKTTTSFTKSSENPGEITVVDTGIAEMVFLPADTAELAAGAYYLSVVVTTTDDETFTVSFDELPILRKT